jgi:hypothetical protein
MAVTFSTLHIFGYGETQLIKEDYNKKLPTTELVTATPFIDDVYSKKPQDSNASQAYHAINVFYDMRVAFMPKEGEGFDLQWNQVNIALLDALVVEVEQKATD